MKISNIFEHLNEKIQTDLIWIDDDPRKNLYKNVSHDLWIKSKENLFNKNNLIYSMQFRYIIKDQLEVDLDLLKNE